jgi:hypothetical protein
MQRQPRLSRSEVIAGLREHAARFGAVSPASLAEHDRSVLRSMHLHFPSFEAARQAAGVPAVQRRGTRPKRPSRRGVWSKRGVIAELQRLARDGASTAWADLMEAGRGDLVQAAVAHAGGLAAARVEAGVGRRPRGLPVPRWNAATIVSAIKARMRKRQTLASSRAPQDLVAAARWRFGSWDAALAAAGVAAEEVRLRRRAYTRPEIVALVQQLARDGQVVRARALAHLVKLDTVRKLFGSVDAAIRAAGIEVTGAHGNQTWSRERVIDELQARARRGQRTLTGALHRAVQLYFGGAHAARRAAGVDGLLRAPWTRQSLIDELQRRARRGDSGRTLWAACRRLFGSVAEARRAAGVPATQRTDGMAAWSKSKLLAELRRRVRQRLQLSRGLSEGLRRQFGSLMAARAAAGVAPKPAGLAARANVGRRAVVWTPARIRRAFGEPSFDVANPVFVAACIEHFGSVTAARTAAGRGQRQRTWSKATVIAELQARMRHGLTGVGRLLREPAVRLFGSTEAALQAAAQTHVAPRRPSRAAGGGGSSRRGTSASRSLDR